MFYLFGKGWWEFLFIVLLCFCFTTLWVVEFSYRNGVDYFLCPYEGVESREPLKASSQHLDRAEGGLGEHSSALNSSAWNHSHQLRHLPQPPAEHLSYAYLFLWLNHNLASADTQWDHLVDQTVSWCQDLTEQSKFSMYSTFAVVNGTLSERK